MHRYSYTGAGDSLEYSHQDAQLLTHRCWWLTWVLASRCTATHTQVLVTHLITHVKMHRYSYTGAGDSLEYSHQGAQLLTHRCYWHTWVLTSRCTATHTQVLVTHLSTHTKMHSYSHTGASDSLDYSPQDTQLLTHRCWWHCDTLEYSHQDAQLLTHRCWWLTWVLTSRCTATHTQVLVTHLSTHIKMHSYSHTGASDSLEYSHKDPQLLTPRC